MNIADELEKLAKLHSAGSISDVEFEKAKAKTFEAAEIKPKRQSTNLVGKFIAFYFAASILGTSYLSYQASSFAGIVLGVIFAGIFVCIGLGKIVFLLPEKWFKITILGLLSIFIILIVSLSERNDYKNTEANNKEEKTKENQIIREGVINEKVIEGLMPVDLYQALEKEGFSTTKEFNPCCTWYSSLGGNSPIMMSAQAHGNNANSIYRINARVVTTVDKNTNNVARPFFGYLATIQYTGSKPTQARAWVEENIGKRTSAQFGPVRISLDYGNENAVMLSITPE